jgi:putative flippase GtrA
MRKLLTSIIDFFYPPFKKLLPKQTFRYAACGGGNMVLGLVLYFVLFHFVFNETNVHTFIGVFKAHNAALFVSGCITFCVGFLLNKYVVFVASVLQGRIQLFRYFLSFSTNLVINYFLLRLFIEVLHIEEFLAQVISTILIVSFSYLTQKHFSFKEEQVQ